MFDLKRVSLYALWQWLKLWFASEVIVADPGAFCLRLLSDSCHYKISCKWSFVSYLIVAATSHLIVTAASDLIVAAAHNLILAGASDLILAAISHLLEYGKTCWELPLWHDLQVISISYLMSLSNQFSQGTMGLERGLCLYRKMTPPPNFGHFWIIFEGWSQNLPSTKLFRHGFKQSCSTMMTKKLEEKVQQCDEDAESSKTGCKSPSRAHGKADDMCKWLDWSATGMPAASCMQLPFEGALLLTGSKIY